jgi:mannose-1-phosphate guanylyltransferase/mannose-6-phosphate isomerase
MSGLVPVVLAGGKGVRLWPVSREAMPKPYIHTSDAEQTLLQATLRRVADLGMTSETLVVCNQDHDFIVSAQAQSSARNGVRLILEPDGRNTAPAICAAALIQMAKGNDDPMLVLPADHLIKNQARFAEAVRSGMELAETGHLVTFAVKPTFPATGYGYLKIGAPINEARKQFHIESFVEKPDAAVAMTFVASGKHAWNSGMFMFKPSVLIAAFAELQPGILQACRDAVPEDVREPTIRLNRAAFMRAPSISIDYAIMEKSSNVATVLADFDWSDVGDWQAVWSVASQDDNNNAVFGNAHVVDSSGSLVHSDGPLLVGVGLVDMIAVATKDAIVVAPMQRAQDVKRAVEQLKAKNLPEASSGRKVLRPWGSYEQLHVGPGFQVKELTVLPGAKLSLQRHRFRAEHWVCIAGEGYAVRGEDRIHLSTGEGVYIPLGSIHRLENPGPEVLRIVETQIGKYTGEDDIERIEDIYGRV